MCGIISVLLADKSERVNQILFDGLTMLQHRGQDAAGMITGDERSLFMRKGNGLARSVFSLGHMIELHGHIGVAHVRYPTAGSSTAAEAQPFYTNSPYGVVIGHNGNLTNTAELREELWKTNARHMNTNSDSEVLLNVLADELLRSRPAEEEGEIEVDADMVFTAMEGVYKRIRGAYAVVGMIVGHGIFGFRDPFGIRPLVFGKRDSEEGTDYMFASESVAMEALGFELIRDVAPGEMVFITLSGVVHHRLCMAAPVLAPCIFEYVYLASPVSVIDGIRARLNMGVKLAERIKKYFPHEEIDVVIPVPDTSRTCAMTCSEALGLPYREGFIKNRYIARTFIMPGQSARKKSVQQKLCPIKFEFAGKNVLLVDDSIVRGTTSRELVRMAKAAGAKKVFFASAAPAIRFPNVYGIDMPSRDELIAHGKTDEEVAPSIEADWVCYLDLDSLKLAILETAAEAGVKTEMKFDSSCFDGCYVTGDIDEEYFSRLHIARNDKTLKKLNNNFKTVEDLDNIDMYNSS